MFNENIISDEFCQEKERGRPKKIKIWVRESEECISRNIKIIHYMDFLNVICERKRKSDFKHMYNKVYGTL